MVGGLGKDGGLSSAEATADGIAVEADLVADFGRPVQGHCLVAVDNGTLMSFGGEPFYNYRTVARLNVGDGKWEVGANQPKNN